MPPGWYQDPSHPSQLRWWDGWRWTEHVAPVTAPDPARGRPVRPAVLWGAVAGFVVVLLLLGVALAVIGSRSSSTSAGARSGSGANAGGSSGSGRERGPTDPTVIPAPDPGPGGVERLAEAAHIPVLDEEGSVTHTHTLVKIHLAERAFPVMAYIGIDRSTGRLAAVHTHDSTGVVHVESPARDDQYTIGQFLTLAGYGSSEADLCDWFAHAACSVRVEVTVPTAEDRDVFDGYGPMPAQPSVEAAGLDTTLAQGAVVDVHIERST